MGGIADYNGAFVNIFKAANFERLDCFETPDYEEPGRDFDLLDPYSSSSPLPLPSFAFLFHFSLIS